MKTIFLMRHSIPERLDLSTEQLPLSEAGRTLALERKLVFSDINQCFSSPYQRALETAKLIAGEDNVQVIEDLYERLIGDAKEDFWYRQYTDYDYHNAHGESLNDVKQRMKAAMQKVLHRMKDGESALVVSHATAICAYLLNYCVIEVTDTFSKSRKITRNGQVIFNGQFNPTDYFILRFEDDMFDDIAFGIK